MEFNEYYTHHNLTRKIIATNVPLELDIDKDLNTQLKVEKLWELSLKPYVNLYPSMANALSKVNLKVDCSSITWFKDLKRHEPLCIRFAKKHEPVCFDEKGKPLESIIISMASGIVGKTKHHKGMLLYAQFGKMQSLGMDIPNTYWLGFPLIDGKTIEECIDEYISISDYADILSVSLRCAIGVLLVSSDPDYTIPEVLSKHKARYAETKDQSLIDKAKRNGKFGWTVGENIETVAHVRIPHFAIRHTGPGGKIPKLVPIKGSIVNRSKLIPKREENG